MSCAGYVTVSTAECSKVVDVSTENAVKVVTNSLTCAPGTQSSSSPSILISTADCKKIVEVSTTNVVKVVTEGPAGATGEPGPPGPSVTGLGAIPDVNASGVTDRSVLYYDAASSTFKLDSSVTTTTLTDGGNF